jgi:hypothetical protein
MELSDQKMIDILLAAGQAPVRKTRRPRRSKSVKYEATYETPVSKNCSRRCTCGVCAQCLDNERWERIFQEKFADPHYYSTPPRRRSSLSLS